MVQGMMYVYSLQIEEKQTNKGKDSTLVIRRCLEKAKKPTTYKFKV
jgi:hypothetical protein